MPKRIADSVRQMHEQNQQKGLNRQRLKDADMLFEKTAKEGKKELEKASEKANLECDILSQTADKNRKRVIDGAIQRLSL